MLRDSNIRVLGWGEIREGESDGYFRRGRGVSIHPQILAKGGGICDRR